ncbi:MAG: clan AA aspartic protease [Pyrinomonadaceae bacterium]
MGDVFTNISLTNPGRSDLKPVEVRALVDTGAGWLCIPEHVCLQLDLQNGDHREVAMADGSKSIVPYVGPIKVAFENRSCYVGALVLGDEVLLGAIPLEDMDLVISPLRGTVTVNPDSPNIPHGRVK